MQLMELPDELLSQIVSHVGGPSLRSDVRNLTISRNWFKVAGPVFLARLDVSRIKLNAISVSKFPTATSSRLLQLISRETQHLTIRLLGHYWDSGTSRDYEFWDADETSSTDDDDESENKPSVPEAELRVPTQSPSLLAWRSATNTKLTALSVALANFTALTTLRLEFAAESDANLGPLWDYLSNPTLTSLLTRIPLHHALTDLTLDLCGTSIDAATSTTTDPETHTCRLIAHNLLPHLSRLRIRTRTMCPAILALPPTTITPKLEVLILKLHQPFWQQFSGRSSAETFCTRHCADACARNDLHGAMYAAAQKALPHLGPQLRVFRIGYADVGTRGAGIGIRGVDVLAGVSIGVPEEVFVYEDEGCPCWWEEGAQGFGAFVY